MIVRKQVTLERFEGRQAVLAVEGGQRLTFAREELGQVQEGQVFVLQIMSEAEAALEGDALARILLTQLIQEDGQPGSSGD